MPIRFRCRYCNQLMGIARRKAGMTVHCPTCHAQVVVPEPDAAMPPEPPADKPAAAAAPLFERSDFEAFLQNPATPPPAAAAPPAPPPPLPPSPFAAIVPSAPSVAPPSAAPRPRPPGLLLSPTQATWLTVVVILLVALAFGAGLLVGHYWMG